MKILIIAPHPDDETIGCGGAICDHLSRGDSVSIVFLTSGELGLKKLPAGQARAIREREATAAAKILGVRDLFFLRGPDWMLGEDIAGNGIKLRPILKELTPEIIYLPHPGDAHPDHQASLPILRSSLRNLRLPRPTLAAYEVWSPLPAWDHVLDISQFMPTKLRALSAHKSQLVEFDYIRAATGLNQYRGALAAKSRFAEVFSLP